MTGRSWISCILSKFYIKPQLFAYSCCPYLRCILSKFYIKPQLFCYFGFAVFRCILSKFYIKPQLLENSAIISNVVSYRNSTSNHNLGRDLRDLLRVVSYRNSTSNHNKSPQNPTILPRCILSKFYIKPQRNRNRICGKRRCILSKFYIKPQRRVAVIFNNTGCILSKFYIKPQLKIVHGLQSCVVSYRNSTSNHNFVGKVLIFVVLYLIEILHQTTTSGLILIDKVLLTGCLPL